MKTLLILAVFAFLVWHIHQAAKSPNNPWNKIAQTIAEVGK